MSDLISVNEADALLKAHIKVTPAVPCPLSRAAGRVLRENILADRDLPPYDRCMMDGYAVRAHECDDGQILRIRASQYAGQSQVRFPTEPMSALEVMTGSVLPSGADAVIPYEDTSTQDASHISLQLSEPVAAGDYVHAQGSDYARGTTLIEAGTRFGPVEAGIAASCGYHEPLLSQHPRITIFSTGDELVEISAQPQPHQIRMSNSFAIENALALSGYCARQVIHLRDNLNAELPKLEAALHRSDIIIISGAVSKGKRDWIAPTLNELSQQIFHGVAQRPGKPMGFWKKPDSAAIFGLPGNPVSSLVATYRYVLPYLKQMVALQPSPQPMLELAEPFDFPKNLTFFLPISLNAAGKAIPQAVYNSGDYARLAQSDGFIELPADASHWDKGQALPAYFWQK